MTTVPTIDKTGVYVTRGGRLAFIVEVRGGGMAHWHGYLITGTRLNSFAQWDDWTPDGRLIGSSTDHEKDILRQI